MTLLPNEIRLLTAIRSRGEYEVRIKVPSYDGTRPNREVSTGWFMGDDRGITLRVTELPDLRAVANALLQAADELESAES